MADLSFEHTADNSNVGSLTKGSPDKRKTSDSEKVSDVSDKCTIDTSNITPLSEEVLVEGQSLNIIKYAYKDHAGAEKTLEVVGRTASLKNEASDCFVTLAVYRRDFPLTLDCLVLLKQYRPSLKMYTLELPAGLVDSSESPEETAIRELKEKTGYICNTFKHTSPMTALDASLSKCTMKVVTLEIDGDAVINRSPRQKEDYAKSIEVKLVPICDLLTRLNEFSKEGVMIDTRVYSFAVGFAIGSKTTTYKSATPSTGVSYIYTAFQY